MTSNSNLSFGIKAVAAVVVVAAVATLFGHLSDEEHEYRRAPKHEDTHVGSRRARSGNNNWFESHYFLNDDGLAIFWRSWIPISGVDPEIKALVIVSHGLAEHSGRYEHLATILRKLGYAVYALDHQGHGQSEGTRGYVKTFKHFPRDVIQLTELAKRKHPLVKKVFLLGHSMGSLISIHTVNAAPNLYDGVVLSAPPLAADIPPGVKELGPLVSKYLPKLPGPGIEGIETLCRDPNVVDRYWNDPLVAMGSNKMRLLGEVVAHMDEAHKIAPDFPIPYLLMHGTGDKMCLHRGSVEFHEGTKVEDKTFVTFEGAFHELFNEPDAEDHAIAKTVEWLNSRVQK